MKQLITKIIITLGVTSLLTPLAHANSYLELITTKPHGHISTNHIHIPQYVKRAKPNTWYDSRVSIKSPVVTSSYPKYLAWQQSKSNEHFHYNYKETIQNTIYTLEAIALGTFIYEMLDN
jgi:hypothetical protein